MATARARCLTRQSLADPPSEPSEFQPPKTVIPDHTKVSSENFVDRGVYTRERFFPRLSLFLSLFDSVSFATAVSKLTLLPFSSPCFCWSTLLHIQDVAQRTSSKSDSCVESCFSSNRIVGGIKTTSQRNAYGRMKVSRTTSRNGYQWIPMPLLFPCFLFLFLGFFVLLE